MNIFFIWFKNIIIVRDKTKNLQGTYKLYKFLFIQKWSEKNLIYWGNLTI